MAPPTRTTPPTPTTPHPNLNFPYGKCVDKITGRQEPSDSTLETIVEAHDTWSADMTSQGFIYLSVTAVGMGVTSTTSLFKDSKVTEKYLMILNIVGCKGIKPLIDEKAQNHEL